MREYLVRATNGSGWIAVKQDRLNVVFVPDRTGASVIEGWGEMRFAYAGMEFAVSGEEVGWQIVVEGQIDASIADGIVAQLTDQLGRESGHEASWSVITE